MGEFVCQEQCQGHQPLWVRVTTVSMTDMAMTATIIIAIPTTTMRQVVRRCRWQCIPPHNNNNSNRQCTTNSSNNNRAQTKSPCRSPLTTSRPTAGCLSSNTITPPTRTQECDPPSLSPTTSQHPIPRRASWPRPSLP